jgi:hypothetical protein
MSNSELLKSAGLYGEDKATGEKEYLLAAVMLLFGKAEHLRKYSLCPPDKKHSWGQRAVRIYDPDGHIIEVGEVGF